MICTYTFNIDWIIKKPLASLSMKYLLQIWEPMGELGLSETLHHKLETLEGNNEVSRMYTK